jgi:hypothetical protein
MYHLNRKSTLAIILLVSFFMIVISNTYSQINLIKGTIIDSSTLEPVAFATVFLDFKTGTIADEQGFFSLPISSSQFGDTLKITCIGYSGKLLLIDQMLLFQLNTIYLQKNIYELKSIAVKAKARRVQKPEKIISKAIDLIPDNYTSKPVVYKGYYREYLRDRNDFINLFESVLNMEDFGIASTNDFNANLEFKKLNEDFRFDSSLFKPYDNEEKFVPLAKVHVEGKNELALLKSTDPIKNSFGFSVSYIDNFRKDFLVNHNFNNPKLTYLNDRPYYVISFIDNVNYRVGIDRINMNGTIYIDAENYGIKKINYLATMHSSVKTKKLYELNVEYSLREGKYYLDYISYNNLFKTSSFAFTRAAFREDTLVLTFSREISLQSFSPDNIKVLYNSQEQPVELVKSKGNTLQVTFFNTSAISKVLKNNSGSFLNVKNKNRTEEVLSGLSIEFNDITDNLGNPLSSKPFKEYYQYREFFVHETVTNDTGFSANTIDKSKPVFESVLVNGGSDANINWFNTPLIKESTETLFPATQNSRFNNFIITLNENNDLKQEETVYIHTDREVYNPGDTLWFKGYIRNKTYLTPTFLSKGFFIQLVDSKGEITWNEKFLIEGSDVIGQIFIPMSMKEGYYTMIGYCSWMKNFEPENVFKKQIMVQKEKADGPKMRVNFDKGEYFPGDSIHFVITCIDEFNLNIGNVKFDFAVKDNKKVLFKGNGITSKDKDSTFSFSIPKNTQSLPEIEIKARYNDDNMNVTNPVPVNYFVQVDFFPEGGHCLDQTKTNIAFKAVTRNGYPVDIKGEIVDKKGKVLEKVQSEHEGMGSFELKPSNDDSLFMRLLEPAAFMGKRFYLPECRNTGWQLIVNPRNEKIQVEVTNQNIINDTALVTVMVREALIYYKVITSTKNYRFSIPTGDNLNGIAVVTLFDKSLAPQAERLVFINDPGKFKTEMNTDKLRYKPRDSVNLLINLPKDIPNPDNGSWSLSVVDNQLCMTDLLDEPSIAASLLISPEIKGNIHNLNSYLYPFNEKTLANIDLLLMTQGWRDYKQLNSPPGRMPGNRDIISGYLFKQPFGSERQPAQGTVSVFYGGQFTIIDVAKNGRFSFLPGYDINHNTGMFLSGNDVNDKPQISIALDEDSFQKDLSGYVVSLTDSLNKFTVPAISTYNRFNKYYLFTDFNHQWLEEVVIIKTVKKKAFQLTDLAMSKRTAKKEDLADANTVEDLWRLVDPNNSYNEKVSPFYCIDGMLQSQLPPPPPPPAPRRFSFFDRIPDYTWALHIDPKDIKEYTIIKGMEAEALYGFGIQYVIDIKLKPFNERDPNRLWESSIFINKFAIAKEFYKPVYDTEEQRYSQIPDLRKTIHWDPKVQFNSDGVASIKFYNGDRYTRIKCILEGIDLKGFPLHSEYVYDVDLH